MPRSVPVVLRSTPAILLAAGTFRRASARDQRGFARTADGNNDGTARCDIGAYEANAVIRQQRDFRASAVYRFFHREPHAGELSPWVSALNSGLSRADLIEVFMDSEEFRFEGKFITQTYLGILTLGMLITLDFEVGWGPCSSGYHGSRSCRCFWTRVNFNPSLAAI